MRKITFAVILITVVAVLLFARWRNSGDLTQQPQPSAFQKLKELVDEDPESVEARYDLAVAYWDRGLRDRALTELRVVIRQAPGYVPAHLAAAGIHYENGWYQQAIDSSRKVLALAPGQIEAQVLLAGSLALSGDSLGALEALDALVYGRADLSVPPDYDPPRPRAAAWLSVDLSRDGESVYRRTGSVLSGDWRRAERIITTYSPRLAEAERTLRGSFNQDDQSNRSLWEGYTRRELLCRAVLSWAHMRLGTFETARGLAISVRGTDAKFVHVDNAILLGVLMQARVLEAKGERPAAVREMERGLQSFEPKRLPQETSDNETQKLTSEGAVARVALAEMLLEEGKAEAALNLLQEAREASASMPRLNINLANANLLAGKPEQAIAAASNYLSARPESPGARMIATLAYVNRYDAEIEEAESISRGALVDAVRLGALGHLQQAWRRHVARILDGHPPFWPVYSFGAVLLGTEDSAEIELPDRGRVRAHKLAGDIFAKACQAGPQHERHWMGLAVAGLVQGEDEAALHVIEQAVEKFPYSERLHELHVLVLVRSGDTTRAGELLQQEGHLPRDVRQLYLAALLSDASAEQAGDIALELAEGIVQMAYGRHADAQRLFIAAGRDENPLSSLWLARDFVAAGEFERAIESLRPLIAAQGQLAAAHVCLGDALHLAGEDAQAIEAWRKATEIEPDWPRYRQSYARALLERGETEEAMRQYQAALDAGSNSTTTRIELALLLALDKDSLDRAAELAGEALLADPTNPRAMLARGVCLLEQGKGAEAAGHLEAACAGIPRGADARIQLGRCLMSLDAPDRARCALEAAIEIDRDGPNAQQARQLLQSLPAQ